MNSPPGAPVLAAITMLVVLSSVVEAAAAQRPLEPSSTSGHERPELSADAMLDRLVSPRAAARPFPPGFRAVQVSSHDRTGGNIDGGWYSEDLDPVPFEAAGVHPPHPTYVRQDGQGIVLLDEVGPGCLTRMWFTAADNGQGDVTPWGRMQISIDGDPQPRLDIPLTDLTAGADPRFPQPLVGNRDSSSGGNYSYIPICYQSSLVLRMTGVPSDALGWHILQLVKAPVGTPVEVFDPSSFDATQALEKMHDLGTPPSRPPDSRTSARIAGGSGAEELLRRTGAGTVQHIRLAVEPFGIDTLQAAELVVTVDGEEEPQIRAPLASLFGDGGTMRSIQTPGFGMNPAENTGYLSYPIPCAEGVQIEVTSNHPEPVTVNADAWFGRASPELGRLHVEHRIESTEFDTDFRALEAVGSGHLVGWVLDLVGPPGSSDKTLASFLEGDERGYVDGSRSVAFYGTGTEDTFNGGFYYANGAFALPTHGAGPFGAVGSAGTQSQYRHFGGDAWNWSSAIDLGMEHGGNNERSGGSATSTTFSYRRPAELMQTDHVDLGAPGSEHAYGSSGEVERTELTAFFEGRHDGTVPISVVLVGGLYYPSVPPTVSPDAITDAGIAFTEPLDIRVNIDPHNDGVVLRRLLDVGQHPSQVELSVDGRRVTRWFAPRTNPAKRWLEGDLELPAAVTRGKHHLDLRFTPMAGPENLYDLRVYSRKRRATPPPASVTAPEELPAATTAEHLPATRSVPLPATMPVSDPYRDPALHKLGD